MVDANQVFDRAEALQRGRVYQQMGCFWLEEPLPPDDPLWSAGNIIITCHSSGHSPQTEGRRLDLFAENIRRYVNGLPLLNVVDKQRGY